MSIGTLIEGLLGGLEPLDLVGVSLAVVAAPMVVNIYLRAYNRDARQNGTPELRWYMEASIGTFATLLLGTVATWAITDWGWERAARVALVTALMYPLALLGALAGVKKAAPDVAEDLGQAPTEFRGTHDGRAPCPEDKP